MKTNKVCDAELNSRQIRENRKTSYLILLSPYKSNVLKKKTIIYPSLKRGKRHIKWNRWRNSYCYMALADKSISYHLQLSFNEYNVPYCSALLWHRLMGRNVLATSFSGTKKIRAYAHCAKQSVSLNKCILYLHSVILAIYIVHFT